jgi:hypothetical protein
MNLISVDNVKNLVQFYTDNAIGLAQSTNVEVDAEIKIRIIPNFDKNVDAKFIVAGSGKIVMPGRDEVLVNIQEEKEAPQAETTEDKQEEK